MARGWITGSVLWPSSLTGKSLRLVPREPYFALARFNTNGSLDTSFGNSGKLTSANSVTGGAHSCAIQSDGKIVLAGESTPLSLSSVTDFALARFNTNGSLDTSFGNNGTLTTDFNGLEDSAYSMAIQPDGKIVVAGNAGIGFYPAFALARYNGTGPAMQSIENDGAKVIDSVITLTDPDSSNMASATIQINGNYHSNEDTLSITPGDLLGGVHASWDAGIGKLTLTGSATTANYVSMLEHIRYTNSSDDPHNDPRTLTWTVNDGTVNSTPQATTITVTAVNDAPVISGFPTL